MTTNNTQGLDEILDSLAECSVDSSRQGYTKAYEYAADAKQAILQWVADTCIGDDSDTPNVMIAMEHNRQRQILRAAGWKPSDKEDG